MVAAEPVICGAEIRLLVVKNKIIRRNNIACHIVCNAENNNIFITRDFTESFRINRLGVIDGGFLFCAVMARINKFGEDFARNGQNGKITDFYIVKLR